MSALLASRTGRATAAALAVLAVGTAIGLALLWPNGSSEDKLKSAPILLVFSVGDLPFGDTVNREVIAEAIVSTLVGSIGLMAAVPLTTGLAALLAVRTPAESLPDDGHSH